MDWRFWRKARTTSQSIPPGETAAIAEELQAKAEGLEQALDKVTRENVRLRELQALERESLEAQLKTKDDEIDSLKAQLSGLGAVARRVSARMGEAAQRAAIPVVAFLVGGVLVGLIVWGHLRPPGWQEATQPNFLMRPVA